MGKRIYHTLQSTDPTEMANWLNEMARDPEGHEANMVIHAATSSGPLGHLIGVLQRLPGASAPPLPLPPPFLLQ